MWSPLQTNSENMPNVLGVQKENKTKRRELVCPLCQINTKGRLPEHLRHKHKSLSDAERAAINHDARKEAGYSKHKSLSSSMPHIHLDFLTAYLGVYDLNENVPLNKVLLLVNRLGVYIDGLSTIPSSPDYISSKSTQLMPIENLNNFGKTVKIEDDDLNLPLQNENLEDEIQILSKSQNWRKVEKKDSAVFARKRIRAGEPVLDLSGVNVSKEAGIEIQRAIGRKFKGFYYKHNGLERCKICIDGTLGSAVNNGENPNVDVSIEEHGLETILLLRATEKIKKGSEIIFNFSASYPSST